MVVPLKVILLNLIKKTMGGRTLVPAQSRAGNHYAPRAAFLTFFRKSLSNGLPFVGMEAVLLGA
jgi:hypothetical protein